MSKITLTDVNRRAIATRLVTQDGVQVLAVEEHLDNGQVKRLMLLNKFDAQQLKADLGDFLKEVYARELAGMEGTLSPADMMELFGEA